MNDKRDLPIGRIEFCHSGSSGGGTIFPGPGNVCRRAEKDKRIAELEAEIAALQAEKKARVDAAEKLQRLREADPDYARVMYESGLSGDDGGAD